MDKTALETLLSSYNWWMGISTIAVAVGILGEYAAHFIFEAEARRNKREMTVSILFGALVLGGVVGEYIFGKKLSQVSEQLHQMADTEVAQANEDAAAARKDAEGLRLQIAQTNERAANAERETARLTAQLADRTLTDKQVQSIAGKLIVFKGQEYTLTAYWQSKESLGIANRVHQTLQMARWSYFDEGSKSMMMGGVIGIFVFTHPDADERTKQAAEGIVEALHGEGLEAATKLQSSQNNPKHNKIWISFGAKR
jgi:hypothetical protein